MKKTVLILALVILSHCAIGQIILKDSDNPLYINVLSISGKDSVIVDSSSPQYRVVIRANSSLKIMLYMNFTVDLGPKKIEPVFLILWQNIASLIIK